MRFIKGEATDYTKESCREFARRLASADPTPGGGGAAAAAAAMGAALGEMVAALTVGKKRYAAVEEEIKTAAAELDRLREELLDMVMEDARGFIPLSRAYRLPKDEPGREDKLEKAALSACAAPKKIMELGCRALELTAVMGEKGSVMAQSDAGCAAALIKAAVDSAALNVYINTKSLRDREQADRLNRSCLEMQNGSDELRREIYGKVRASLLEPEK